MGLRRYTASKDNTITNAYKPGLIATASLSNLGASDILEVFYIAHQVSTTSEEMSRILIQFPVDQIESDLNAGIIPSGSEYHLRLFNCPHGETLPRQFTLNVRPLEKAWTEGIGLDHEGFSDRGESNWVYASASDAWDTAGGDFVASPIYAQYFDRGHEDLSINITSLVNQWIDGSLSNHGIGIMLSSSFETGSDSYYTKKFFGRGSQYFLSRPIIEVRFDSSKRDDRAAFYASSSLASADDNLGTLRLYNRIHGQLKNIPSVGTGAIYLRAFTSASGGEEVTNAAVTGGWSSVGEYTASFALQTTASILYDRWYDSNGVCLFTGSFTVKQHGNSHQWAEEHKFVNKITNLKSTYSPHETGSFRVFTRHKNWMPTVYTVATTTAEPTIVRDAHFRVYRINDDHEVVAFDTSSNSTKMSYDMSGSYFELPMNIFEPGYMYAIKLMFNHDGDWKEQPETFKFKVK